VLEQTSARPPEQPAAERIVTRTGKCVNLVRAPCQFRLRVERRWRRPFAPSLDDRIWLWTISAHFDRRGLCTSIACSVRSVAPLWPSQFFPLGFHW